MTLDEIKKSIHKELENYKKDKTNFKAYSQSMKESNTWLKEIKK